MTLTAFLRCTLPMWSICIWWTPVWPSTHRTRSFYGHSEKWTSSCRLTSVLVPVILRHLSRYEYTVRTLNQFKTDTQYRNWLICQPPLKYLEARTTYQYTHKIQNVIGTEPVMSRKARTVVGGYDVRAESALSETTCHWCALLSVTCGFWELWNCL